MTLRRGIFKLNIKIQKLFWLGNKSCFRTYKFKGERKRPIEVEGQEVPDHTPFPFSTVYQFPLHVTSIFIKRIEIEDQERDGEERGERINSDRESRVVG